MNFSCSSSVYLTSLVAAVLAAIVLQSNEAQRLVDRLLQRGSLTKQPSAPEGFAVPPWMEERSRVRSVDFSAVENLDEREPLILKNSPMREWPALGKWTPEYLAEKVSMLRKVRRSKTGDNVFLYENNALLMRKYDSEGKFIPLDRYELVNMTTKEFFESSGLIYYSHLFATTKYLEEPLGKDINPRDFLVVVDDERLLENLANVFDTNLWMSREGIVAGLHQDMTHNMFAQIYGCKRFLIVEYDQWKRLKFFPTDHPNDRQSQMEIDEVATNFLREREKPIGAMVADIGAGDVLYLPPLFPHRVAAFKCNDQNHSISINTWSTGVVQQLAKTANNKQVIPQLFQEYDEERHEERVGALALYLRILIENVSSMSVKDFLDVIVKGSFSSQKKMADALHCSDFNSTLCPRKLLQPAEFMKQHPETAKMIQEHAESVAGLFHMFEHLEPEILENVLTMNVQVVTTLVTSIPKMCPFLQCLAAVTD